MTQAPSSTPPPVRKRRRRWPWIVGGLVVLVVIIAIAASAGGSTPSATTPVSPASTGASHSPIAAPAAKTATVGSTVAFTNSDGAGTVTLNGVRTMAVDETTGTPPKNGTWLVVNVTVAATKGTATPNPLAFSVTGPDGTHYDASLAAVTNQIDSTDVVAGRQTRGDVAFDVPKGQPMLLDYAIFGPPLATFSIPAS